MSWADADDWDLGGEDEFVGVPEADADDDVDEDEFGSFATFGDVDEFATVAEVENGEGDCEGVPSVPDRPDQSDGIEGAGDDMDFAAFGEPAGDEDALANASNDETTSISPSLSEQGVDIAAELDSFDLEPVELVDEDDDVLHAREDVGGLDEDDEFGSMEGLDVDIAVDHTDSAKLPEVGIDQDHEAPQDEDEEEELGNSEVDTFGGIDDAGSENVDGEKTEDEAATDNDDQTMLGDSDVDLGDGDYADVGFDQDQHEVAQSDKAENEEEEADNDEMDTVGDKDIARSDDDNAGDESAASFVVEDDEGAEGDLPVVETAGESAVETDGIQDPTEDVEVLVHGGVRSEGDSEPSAGGDEVFLRGAGERSERMSGSDNEQMVVDKVEGERDDDDDESDLEATSDVAGGEEGRAHGADSQLDVAGSQEVHSDHIDVEDHALNQNAPARREEHAGPDSNVTTGKGSDHGDEAHGSDNDDPSMLDQEPRREIMDETQPKTTDQDTDSDRAGGASDAVHELSSGTAGLELTDAVAGGVSIPGQHTTKAQTDTELESDVDVDSELNNTEVHGHGSDADEAVAEFADSASEVEEPQPTHHTSHENNFADVKDSEVETEASSMDEFASAEGDKPGTMEGSVANTSMQQTTADDSQSNTETVIDNGTGDDFVDFVAASVADGGDDEFADFESAEREVKATTYAHSEQSGAEGEEGRANEATDSDVCVAAEHEREDQGDVRPKLIVESANVEKATDENLAGTDDADDWGAFEEPAPAQNAIPDNASAGTDDADDWGAFEDPAPVQNAIPDNASSTMAEAERGAEEEDDWGGEGEWNSGTQEVVVDAGDDDWGTEWEGASAQAASPPTNAEARAVQVPQEAASSGLPAEAWGLQGAAFRQACQQYLGTLAPMPSTNVETPLPVDMACNRCGQVLLSEAEPACLLCGQAQRTKGQKTNPQSPAITWAGSLSRQRLFSVLKLPMPPPPKESTSPRKKGSRRQRPLPNRPPALADKARLKGGVKGDGAAQTTGSTTQHAQAQPQHDQQESVQTVQPQPQDSQPSSQNDRLEESPKSSVQQETSQPVPVAPNPPPNDDLGLMSLFTDVATTPEQPTIAKEETPMATLEQLVASLPDLSFLLSSTPLARKCE